MNKRHAIFTGGTGNVNQHGNAEVCISLPAEPWDASPFTARDGRPETRPDPRVTLCQKSTERGNNQSGRLSLEAIRKAHQEYTA